MTGGGDPLREENRRLARLFEETADLLEHQGANPFRVRAYREAARTLRGLREPVRQIWARGGVKALLTLPGIGETLARTIQTWLETGTLGILYRLRGEEAAERLLRTVPGIGAALARRIHEELGIESLEELEAAAHDGRLAALPGLGPRRVRSIRDQLATRLRHRRREPEAGVPAVAELLDVDREYRELAAAGRLPRIAPRRFNPEREAWLPILHTRRGRRHYTALFSNTPLAHRLGRTRDWVVIFLDDGRPERQWTVVTETRGPLQGKRVVRGREEECAAYYAAREGLPVSGLKGTPTPP